MLTVTAVDDDTEDDIEEYEIVGGADWELFSIVSSTGVLTFKTAPDYETPQDIGSNNQYVVVVRATSGGTVARERTADQTITVTVTNVSGGRTIRSTLRSSRTPRQGERAAARHREYPSARCQRM